MENASSTLAVKYRPKTFSGVVGQADAVTLLRSMALRPERSPRSIVVSGPYGTGKCVEGSTRVSTSAGYIRIDSLSVMPKVSGEREGYMVTDLGSMGVEVQQDDGSFREAEYLYETLGKERVIYLHTSTGKVLNGTGKHKILVRDEDSGEGKLKRLDSIGVGDVVLCRRGLLVPSRKAYLGGWREHMGCYKEGRDFACGIGAIAKAIAKAGRGGKESDLYFVRSSEERVWYILGIIRELGEVEGDYGITLGLGSEELSGVFQELFESLGIYVTVFGEDVYIDGRDLGFMRDCVELAGSDLVDSPNGFSDSRLEELLYGGRRGDTTGHLYTELLVGGISEGYSRVYDLSVSSTGVFRAQGVLNHNTTLSRVFARAFACEKFGVSVGVSGGKDVDICGECAGCRGFGGVSGLYLEYDSSDVGNVEDIKGLRPVFDMFTEGYRVIVLDECHLISLKAQAALLKVLEEVSVRTFFVLCTTEPERLLKPILSRSLHVELRLVCREDIEQRLREVIELEGVEVPERLLRKIALKSDGHVRDSLMVLSSYLLTRDEGVVSFPIEEVEGYIDSLSKGHLEAAGGYVDKIMMYPLSQVRRALNGVILGLMESSYSGGGEYVEMSCRLGGLVLQLYKLVCEGWVSEAFRDDYLARCFFITLMRKVRESMGKFK